MDFYVFRIYMEEHVHNEVEIMLQQITSGVKTSCQESKLPATANMPANNDLLFLNELLEYLRSTYTGILEEEAISSSANVTPGKNQKASNKAPPHHQN